MSATTPRSRRSRQLPIRPSPEATTDLDRAVSYGFVDWQLVITLEDDIAVSRGDILCRPNNRPTVTHDL